MDFKKLEQETINEYICRIGLLREKYNLTWADIIKYIYEEFGVQLTKDSVRKRYRRAISNYITEENIEQKIDDKKYLYRIQAEKNQLQNYYKVLSREETLKDIGIEAAKIIAEKNPLKIDFKYNFNSEKEGILLIGDWHYGININSKFNVYNTDVAKERVEFLCESVINHIMEHNLSKLHVLNLGDMIAGNIHLPLRLHSQTDVITQILEVSEVIADFIYILGNYVNIEYYSTLDNHSRIEPNKKDSIQLETLSRITPWFLKERFKDSKHIHFNDNQIQDIVQFSIGTYKVMAVHGDKDKPGEIINKLTSFVGEHKDLICTAHYHHFSCDESNKTMLVSNGSLMGTDEYAMDLRLSSKPSQTLIISDANNVCSYICKIDLS